MSDQQDKKKIEIEGNVVGSAVGDGKVTAENIAGGDINITHVHGDQVAGDKVGGDKVLGNKIETEQYIDQQHVTNNYILPQPRPDAVNNLPPFNPHFVGRQEYLTAIANNFSATTGSLVVTQAIAGLGGIGKTQLALAYAHMHRDQYDIMWVLQANETTTLDLSLRQLGETLELDVASKDVPTVRAMVLSYLNSSKKDVLLLYDNVDQMTPAALRPYLPSACHLLITSRRDESQWGGLANVMRLGLFSEAEAVAFLLGDASTTTDETEAKELAELLGYLPLALEHARAYVAASGCSLSDYADYFRSERRELWADAPAPMAYDKKTITTTWNMAFNEARKTAGAAALLNLCCFLAADDIPLTLLTEAKESRELPDALAALRIGRRQLDNAIGALRRYSLVQRTDGMLTMHRLVQAVARDQIPPNLLHTWLGMAIELLADAYRFDPHDMSTWAQGGTLIPHMSVVSQLAHDALLDLPTLGFLNNEVGVYLKIFGDYEGALPYFVRSLAIDEQALGSDHPDVAIDLNNLGSLLQTMGDFEGARPYYERTLDIDEKALGPDHPDVAIDLNNLGSLCYAEGDYKSALVHFERSLEIKRVRLGEEHPSTKTTQSWIDSVKGKLEDNS